ncbi:MAG: gluconokinase [Caldilineaceae bacterium]
MPPTSAPLLFVVLMGVSGSGKTTVGELLAAQMGWRFYDGDKFHTPENVAKMAAGTPLTDADRAGWLAVLAGLIRDGLARGESGVIACSALKETYRDFLRVDPSRVCFVYLKGSFDLIWERMLLRQNHYMKASMLQSQFASLEEPEGVLTCDITASPEQIVDAIVAGLGLERPPG